MAISYGLTVIDRELFLNLLLEQRHNVFDDVLLLGLEVLMVLRPVSRRDCDEIPVLDEASELGPGVNVFPFLYYEMVEAFLLNMIQVVLANAGRFEKLIDIGEIHNAQCLPSSDPDCVSRAVPVGLDERRSS